MAKILKFQKKQAPNDLNALLKIAVDLRRKLPAKGGTEDPKELFLTRISEILLDKHMIGEDFFLCGLHAAEVLTDLVETTPPSWFAIDYIIDGDNPEIIKEGAKVCFLICSVFKGRGNFRLMREKYYRDVGIGLYHRFYLMTEKMIGLHMARQFDPMALVVKECLKKI